MRPTTKRRLFTLAITSLIICITLAGIYIFREHQINSRIMSAKAEGMTAFRQGDYAGALEPLSYYNTHRQDDPETLFAFGKARSRVEAPNNRHLAEAIQYFRRGLELQPDNVEARHLLLQIYSDPSVGYNAEAITLAGDLLKSNPKDVDALRAKSKSLYALRRFDEAFAASSLLNQVAPGDLQGQRITLELLYQLKRPSDEIVKTASKNLAAHPGDPRFVLLQGYAYMLANDAENAKIWLLKAASATPPDADFVRECSMLLDANRMFDKSQELLERAAGDGKDPRMMRMLIQRLWQNGRYSQVVDRLQSLDPNSTRADSNLLAYRAFSLYQLQRNDEAKSIVNALAARTDDDVALAWVKALRAQFDDASQNPKDKILQYQAALVRDPGNPVIRYMMGQAYARLGETELALQAWRQVVREVPSWPTPRTQIAYLLASTGRTQSAFDEAANAYARGQNLGSAIGLAVAWNAKFDRSDNPAELNSLLKLVTEIQSKVPGESQTLPIYVSVLARTNHREQAVAAIHAAIQASNPLNIDAWLWLVSISRDYHLAQERAILDHVEKSYGLVPSVALANAMLLAESGQAAKGLNYLTSTAAKSSTDTADWKLTIARYREQIKDHNARQAWIEVGDQFPGNMTVQGAIIDLPDTATAWQDRDLIDRTIQRMHELTGDQGFRWQLARCRWLLTSPNRDRDSAEAVVRLTDIVRGAPALVIPRLYLARAMENVDNISAAEEQLRAAAEMEPDNIPISLELVRLLQSEGKFDNARPYLERVSHSVTDASTRQSIASYYFQQGDLDSAINLLAPLDSPLAGAMLADLYRRKGDFNKASSLYEKLIAQANPDPDLLAAAADFFASRNQMDNAHAALDRVTQLHLPPGHQQIILATFTDKHGSKDAAEKLYRAAVAANPADADLWRQLITFQLHQNQFDQAKATAQDALKQIPGNLDIQSLRTQAIALGAAGGQVDTESLITELSKDPRNAAAVECLQASAEIRRNNDSPDRALAKIRRIADRYPRFMPVQIQLIKMNMDLHRHDDAAVVATRAMASFPNDPAPARLAAMIYASDFRWNDVLSAANEWRNRSLEHPIQADLAIARARLALKQPEDALLQLQPYLDESKQHPDDNALILTTYAQALIADDRLDDAAALLLPFLNRSDDWRGAWLRLTSQITNQSAAEKWVNQAASAIPSDSISGPLDLADAWYAIGTRFQHPAAYIKAAAIIAPVTRRPNVTVQALVLAGAIAEKLSQPDAAIADYRHALQLDSKLPPVQNNLAYLLLSKGAELDQARDLAERAVAASPADPNYYDTLARIYAKIGNRDRAIAAFQKVLDLQPNNVSAMVPTIRLLHEQGQQQAARSMMLKLESLLQANPILPPAVDMDVKSLRQSLN